MCTLKGPTEPITEISVTADTHAICAGSKDQTLTVWQSQTRTSHLGAFTRYWDENPTSIFERYHCGEADASSVTCDGSYLVYIQEALPMTEETKSGTPRTPREVPTVCQIWNLESMALERE